MTHGTPIYDLTRTSQRGDIVEWTDHLGRVWSGEVIGMSYGRDGYGWALVSTTVGVIEVVL